MSGGRPKLEVVPGGAGSETPPAAGAAEAGAGEPKRRNVMTWLLVALLVAVGVALVLENRRATGLVAEVQSLENVIGELEAELSATEGALSAHRTHLESVRSYVSGLSELVEQDPEQAP